MGIDMKRLVWTLIIACCALTVPSRRRSSETAAGSVSEILTIKPGLEGCKAMQDSTVLDLYSWKIKPIFVVDPTHPTT